MNALLRQGGNRPRTPSGVGCRAIPENLLGPHFTVPWCMSCTGKDFSQVSLRTGRSSPPEPKYSGWAVLGGGDDQEFVCKREERGSSCQC